MNKSRPVAESRLSWLDKWLDDVDSYFDQARSYIKTLIENQLKEMESAKIIMTLWVLWKKPIKRLIELHTNDTTDDIYYEKIDM